MDAIRLACAALLPLLAACASTAAPRAQPWDNARQLVVVTTADWDAPTGTLHAFEREGEGWRETTPAFTVNVGRSGAGWGLGLHDARDQDAGPRRGEPAQALAASTMKSCSVGCRPGEKNCTSSTAAAKAMAAARRQSTRPG